MDKMIVVRHGHYDHRERLSEVGQGQIATLAERLAVHVDGGNSLTLLSSTAPRAMDSAEILAKKFGVSYERLDVLWTGNDAMRIGEEEDFKELMGIINGRHSKARVVIIVTHYEYVEDFPAFFGKTILNARLHGWVIDYGEAFVIDCGTKEMVHISNRKTPI